MRDRVEWKPMLVSMASFLAIAGLAIGVAVSHAGTRQGPRTVVAGRFVLQDDAGSVRGQWWVEGGTAKLALYDAAGNMTVQAASKAEGGAVVSLHDPDGAQRAALGLSPDGEAALSLRSGNHIALVARKDGSVGWIVRDRDGKVRAGLGMDAKGAIEEQ